MSLSVCVMGQTVSVQNLRPLRKSMCLCIEDTVGRERILAYFRNDYAAMAMKTWLERLAACVEKGESK